MQHFSTIFVALMLIALHAAHNAFLSHVGLPGDSSAYSNSIFNPHFYHLGISSSQAPLLAAWTCYGTGSFAERITWSSSIALLLGLSALFGVFVNQDASLYVEDFFVVILTLAQYAAIVGVILTARRVFRAKQRHHESLNSQLSLKALFGSLTVMALIFAGLSTLGHSARISDSNFSLSFLTVSIIGSIGTAIFLLWPAVFTVAVTMGRTDRWKLAVIPFAIQQVIFLIAGLFLPSGLFIYQLVVFVTMHVAAAITTLPFTLLRLRNPSAKFAA